MNILQASVSVLDELVQILDQTEDEQYQMKLDVFSGSSIGMHTRHIIEFFQCLLSQSCSGVINYDNRERNHAIENSTLQAINSLKELIKTVHDITKDQKLILRVSYSTVKNIYNEVETTLFRELSYNIEHTIHHNALLRIGLGVVAPALKISDSFGVAPSTIKYLSSLN